MPFKQKYLVANSGVNVGFQGETLQVMLINPLPPGADPSAVQGQPPVFIFGISKPTDDDKATFAFGKTVEMQILASTPDEASPPAAGS